MGIESDLVLFGVIETLNQALSRLSSGMSRGKGCSFCFGSGAGVSLTCGGELTFVSHGMAVDWLGADVDTGGVLVRKGSCSIDGNDPVEDSPSDEGGVVGSSTLALNVSFRALLLRWRPCLANSARVSWGWQSRVSW
jgi:hypothetical protein